MASIVTPVVTTVIHEASEEFEKEDDLQNTSADDDKEVVVGREETKAVSFLRWIVFGVLLVVALLVCVGVQQYAKRSEISVFESEFEAYAVRLVDAFEKGATRRLKSMQTLSVAYTAHAQATNMTWPFVTMNDFEIRANMALELADAVCVLLLPLVADDNETRQEWNQYAQANQGWLLDGLLVQAENNETKMTEIIVDDINVLLGLTVDEGMEDVPISTFTNSTINSEILRFDEVEDTVAVEERPGPWFPIWQFAPSVFIPQFVNINTFEIETEYMLEHKEMFVSVAETESDESGFLNIFLSRWNDRYEGGPISNLYVPVFQSNMGQEDVLVGALNSFVYWNLYFEDVLPDKAYGLIVVLENTLNQMYSFEINGPHVTYLGLGDTHDSKYDSLETRTEFGSFIGSFGNSTPVAERLCSYRIRVYASDSMKSEYLTNLPTEMAIILAVTFLFTSFVFLTYDFVVERRQKIVLTEAIKTGTVVNSLFPDNVRDRLYDNEQAVAEETYETKGKSRNSISTRMPTSSISSGSSTGRSGSRPIADLYPNCTVLFADIKGFTKWSSQREPADVFILLETIYGSFDKSAKRLAVCKIETIGDCYLAVTGLPRPQDDHAERMARFAVLLNTKMNQIAHNLVSDLGSDTVNLQMRIGLHSGPVTAGVLRGEKARFQLFGDTVNTASRMESTGEGSKIQLSQETADQLIGAGRANWIEPRDTLIEAKGKGSLQTYWLKKRDLFSSAHETNSSTALSTMDDSCRLTSGIAPSSMIFDGQTPLASRGLEPSRVSPLDTTSAPMISNGVSERSIAV